MSDDDREALKRLDQKAAARKAEWPRPATLLLDGPGPYELPPVSDVSAFLEGDKVVLLLELDGDFRRVRVPLTSKAAPGLEMMAGYLANLLASAASKKH